MEANKLSNNSIINLTQANELSLKLKESLAQVRNSHLGKIANCAHHEFSLRLAHLAQARFLSFKWKAFA